MNYSSFIRLVFLFALIFPCQDTYAQGADVLLPSDSAFCDSSLSSDARFKLFSPLSFSRSAIREAFDFDTPVPKSGLYTDNSVTPLLLGIFISRPELVKTTDSQLLESADIEENIQQPNDNRVEIAEGKADDIGDIADDMPTDLVVQKPNFWTLKGDYMLQFTQNYISANWYKGGESSFSFLAGAVFEANYNNKQKITWDNKLEMRLGFLTSKSDSLHGMKTSQDLLRLTSKFGLQATKRWYYTLQLIAATQFTKGFKSNDPLVYSDFCSPLNINLALGMSYKVEAIKKKLTGSITIAPLSYNFRYVGRLALSPSYGLDADKHQKHDLGSSVVADLTWDLIKNLKWKTRFYAYTTYKRVEVEWENSFTFSFNKFVTATLFLYPRFDDGVQKAHPDDSYFQFN
ncbi:MAG: DUF3078 domain-containing protein, partial [Bacteroidaceae bacterium]|nr:DUF3078 domain-containing protein [Bacteroidaceae bacterium]